MRPKISIVIPTLNAISVLKTCLDAIDMQDYPKDKIEIVLGDGGSTDGTIELAREYGAKVFHNKLLTAESGKAVGVKHATGDLIAIVDSDNFLPTKNWLNEMVVPLMEKGTEDVLGSEPWKYLWRKGDGFIDRYCALIGMNDPFVLFLGNYDRVNVLTGKWTEVPHEEKDRGKYLLVTLKDALPTIGANGTVFRAKYLKKELGDMDYLFDIDILAKTIKEKGEVKFIKTKNSIVHAYCGSNIRKFAKKQRRRVKDFLFHKHEKKDREFDWDATSKNSNGGLLRFVLSCVLVFPLLFQAIKGYSRKRDLQAWLFHILACEITLWEYGWGSIIGLFKKEEISRVGWKQ